MTGIALCLIGDNLQLEGLLEEMLMLCQRGEEYNRFMLAKLAQAFSPKAAPAAHVNTFRAGAFNTAIRELTSYYMNTVSYRLSTKCCMANQKLRGQALCIA